MKQIIVRLALVVLAVFVLAACQAPPTAAPVLPTKAPEPAKAPEPTKAAEPTKPSVRTKANPGEAVTFFHFGDITGPYAATTAPIVVGFNDAVKWLNDKGGIRGAKISVEWADTGGKLENAISTYNRFREKKPPILFLYGSPETEALRDRLGEDKIPVLTAGLSAKGLYPSGYVFGDVPLYTDQFGLFLDWLTANWDKVKPSKGQALDSPKVALITWDGAFGTGALTAETKAYAEKKGVKIIGQELFAIGAPDVTTQILAAKKAGANVIYTNTLAHGPAQILKDSVSLGVRDEFLIAGVNWAADFSMLALAKDAAEGFYGVFPTLWWDDVDNAGVKEVTAQFGANSRKPTDRNVAYLIAYALVDATRQIVEKTVDRVGFDGLTSAAVYETITTMGEIKAMEGITVWSFDKEKRAPSKARIIQVKGGKFVPVSDWMTAPDLRPK